MNFTPQPPAYLGKLTKGEWHAALQSLALPIFSAPEDRYTPPDPDAFVDAYTSYFQRRIDTLQSTHLKDLALPVPDISVETLGLSRNSRKLANLMIVGIDEWGKGCTRAAHQTAMSQAAFAIMKGQPVPNDPVYGLPYRWDPTTRQLTAPSHAALDQLSIKPITLPK